MSVSKMKDWLRNGMAFARHAVARVQLKSLAAKKTDRSNTGESVRSASGVRPAAGSPISHKTNHAKSVETAEQQAARSTKSVQASKQDQPKRNQAIVHSNHTDGASAAKVAAKSNIAPNNKRKKPAASSGIRVAASGGKKAGNAGKPMLLIPQPGEGKRGRSGRSAKPKAPAAKWTEAVRFRGEQRKAEQEKAAFASTAAGAAAETAGQSRPAQPVAAESAVLAADAKIAEAITAVPMAEAVTTEPAIEGTLPTELAFDEEPLAVTQMKVDWRTRLRSYRSQLAKATGALGLAAAIMFGGNYYVDSNTNEIFHVWVGDKYAGAVSDPQIVEDYKIAKYKELEQKFPDVHMVLTTDNVKLTGEKAFNKKADDEAALAKLDQMLVPQAVGTKLIVDGNEIAIVKDKDTAQQILAQIENRYAPSGKQKEETGKVRILSADAASSGQPEGTSEITQVEFVQDVRLETVKIDPDQISDPEQVLESIITGDVQPTIYTVREGDCISCIAQKFGISKQQIYDNNPWIVDDRIRVGDQLNLTVLKPKLSVRTVERFVETEEVQHGTEYVLDDSMRAGITQTIKPGKNGLKKVTFLVTKIDGEMVEEQLIDEQVLVEPVNAVVRKGTKVVRGEGTGKFAWPVLSASVSSGYGNRWGKLHKGIDIVSRNRNILASDNGKVVKAGYKSDYGNHIIIDHQNGYRTLYAHLSKINVKVGQVVEKGEKIGSMGSTGHSTGVHLHFEILRKGSPENPLKYLSR